MTTFVMKHKHMFYLFQFPIDPSISGITVILSLYFSDAATVAERVDTGMAVPSLLDKETSSAVVVHSSVSTITRHSIYYKHKSLYH